jgi:xanthine dehydrogenase accessory factor
MVSIEDEIVKALSQKVPAALATVVDRTGSAPRDIGAKMFLRADGPAIGTIGGGSVEAKVLKEAERVMEAGVAKVLRFELTAKELIKGHSICGGNVTIFVEPLSSKSPGLLEIYQTIAKIRKRGGKSILATIISDNTHSRGAETKALIDEEGQFIGSLSENRGLVENLKQEIGDVYKEGRAKILTLQKDGEQIEILLEPIASEPTVFIFGCGHISTCLAPLVKNVGFRLVVADDRPEFANPKRFPEADEIILDDFEGLLEKLRIDENAYLVIVTRGHFHDKIVLEQALHMNAGYIGMIGSRRKVRMVFRNLMEMGFPKEALDKVHSPIGLKIKAETPEEIAVSILAELIQVRAGDR